MQQIKLDEISKTFKIAQRPEGKFSVLKGAFFRTHKFIKALDEISFGIDEGEVVGYIGPNGAGKSTTVKVMSGILNPDEGNCTIMGRVPWKERVAHVSQIGVVFGQRSQLWWDVPVIDSFDLLKDIYSLSTVEYKNRLTEMVEILRVESLLQMPVRQLSLGQRMRCEIIAALLHKPKILFLDEPTIGLDSVSKLALREFLKKENQKYGVTMILTTHDMDDIETLCKRVLVIGHGKILYDDGFLKLKNKYSSLRCIEATLDKPIPVFNIDGAEEIKTAENVWNVTFNQKHTATHDMVERLAKLLPITDIVMKEQDIDEIIASMYTEMDL